MNTTPAVRDLATAAEYQACVALQDAVWGAGFTERVPAALLKVAQETGGVAAGAFDASDALIGFVFGLTGVRDGRLVHWSDMLAVRQDHRGHGVGAHLKAFQRDRVRALGVTRMLWTFDPLVARNARFNMAHLGARPVDYRVDMYGSGTGSILHGRIPTDRFLMEWDLVMPGSDAGERPPNSDTFPLLDPVNEGGVPEAITTREAEGYRVQVPRDFGAVQQAGGDLALRWRLAVREAAAPLFARGLRPLFFDDRGDALPCYVFMHPRPGGAR
jgi:chorismate synthase